MHLSHLIITDSIEVKEEALSLGKPVLVLMDLIGRQETFEVARFVGTEPVKIINETQNILDNEDAYLQMSQTNRLSSDGRASQRIVDFIMEHEAA
jgi:UDP-N-acetylglucosamine 2-epimerase (non-hydrolysing)